MASVFFGFLFLAAGLWLYVHVSPNWAQAQGWLGQAAMALDAQLRQQIYQTRQMYFGSLIAITGGGLLILIGIVKEYGKRQKHA